MTIEQILEAIENMKVLESNELVKVQKRNSSICFSSVMMAGAVAGAAEKNWVWCNIIKRYSSKVGYKNGEITGLGLKKLKK